MLQLKGTTIQICKYHITGTQEDDTFSRYVTRSEKDALINRYEDLGYTVTTEELDVSNEVWLNGVYCKTIQQANEWLALGYIPKTELEILQETVDTLVLSALEV